MVLFYLVAYGLTTIGAFAVVTLFLAASYTGVALLARDQFGVEVAGAARGGDPTGHGTPLGPGPGCPTVLIGG